MNVVEVRVGHVRQRDEAIGIGRTGHLGVVLGDDQGETMLGVMGHDPAVEQDIAVLAPLGGYLGLGQKLTLRAICGCGLIPGGVLIVQRWPLLSLRVCAETTW